MKIKEADLIKRCIKSDRAAQNQLFNQFGKPVFSAIMRIVGKYDEANDILQDTFIDAFRSLKDFRADSALKTWLTTIAIRKAVRFLKQTRKFDSIDDYQNIKNEDWNGDFTAEYLEKAIQTLPDKARAVFVAYSVEGYKHFEIAEMFGISEGTSKSTLNYAKKLLRIKLKELYE